MKMMNSKKSFHDHWYKIAFVLPMNLAIGLVVNSLNVQTLQAQEVKKEIRLTPKQLKAFEGYYQSRDNKEAFLQFTVKGDNLVAIQLPEGHEYVLLPESDLAFVFKEEKYPVKFIKNEEGVISQLLALNKDWWDRVKQYKQKKEIQLTPEQLKSFEGKYRFQGDREAFLEITAQPDHLVLKELWSGNEISFVPESELAFFCKDKAFPLKFIKDQDGTISQVLAFNRDLWNRVKQ